MNVFFSLYLSLSFLSIVPFNTILWLGCTAPEEKRDRASFFVRESSSWDWEKMQVEKDREKEKVNVWERKRCHPERVREREREREREKRVNALQCYFSLKDTLFGCKTWSRKVISQSNNHFINFQIKCVTRLALCSEKCFSIVPPIVIFAADDNDAVTCQSLSRVVQSK